MLDKSQKGLRSLSRFCIDQEHHTDKSQKGLRFILYLLRIISETIDKSQKGLRFNSKRVVVKNVFLINPKRD